MTEEKKKGAATESTTFGIWYIMRPLSQDHSRNVLKNELEHQKSLIPTPVKRDNSIWIMRLLFCLHEFSLVYLLCLLDVFTFRCARLCFFSLRLIFYACSCESVSCVTNLMLSENKPSLEEI